MSETGRDAKVNELYVTDIHHGLKLALLNDTRLVPITKYVDNNGDDCTLEEAVAFIAGADGIGWFTLLMADVGTASVH